MKKKIILGSILSCFSLTAMVISLGVVHSGSKNTKFMNVKGDSEPYTFTLDATSMASMNDGHAIVFSRTGGEIQFDYSGLSIVDGNLVFEKGATLSNPKLGYGDNNFISGMTEIQLTVDEEATAAFAADYTWGSSLDSETPYYQRRGYVVSKAYNTYSFMDEQPNFIKLTATEASTVKSIKITFSCQRVDEEPGDNLVISDAVMLERFKTVVNRGNNFEGQTVELGADIDLSTLASTDWSIGVTDALAFKGTFDGKGHTISNYTRTNAGALGLFSRLNGTLKNLNLANVNLTATDQRVAAFVARSAGGTIDNCHVLSGTLNGTTQNGGIVGVAVAPGVTIKNSSNAASLTGSGAGNAGILGYIYSGTVNIENCVNKGTITGGTTGTGGILGQIGTSASNVANIKGCENKAEVIGGTSDGVGGILGWLGIAGATANISYCKNSGTVSRAGGGYGTGGILGLNANDGVVHISKCQHTGVVSAPAASYVGGIVGLGRIPNANTISDCYVSGSVEGSKKANVGFVSGINRNTISNCEVAATAHAKSTDGLDVLAGDSSVKAPKASGNNSYNYIYGGQDTYGTTDVDSCRVITPKEVKFTINYGTNMGQAVFVVGSFSNWHADNRYRLDWTEGNNWVGTFTFAVGDTIEFKFVIAPDKYDPDNSEIIRWESDPNRSLAITADMDSDLTFNWR